MLKKSMKVDHLPLNFEVFIDVLRRARFPMRILTYGSPLRAIEINDKLSDYPYAGVYFGTRIEDTPLPNPMDWKSVGWDGLPRMIIFPFSNPLVTTILHEFAHYVDDAFVQKFKWLQQEAPEILTILFEDRVDVFLSLYDAMKEEFGHRHSMAIYDVEARHGLDKAQQTLWWYLIPPDVVYEFAPSAYAFVNVTEWFAESFVRYCLSRSYLRHRAPKTHDFLKFLMSSKLFAS